MGRLFRRLTDTARRALSWSQELQWAGIALLGAAALALGYFGIHSYLTARGESPDWWEILYPDLQIFVLEPGSIEGDVSWQLDLARILGPLVTVLAALMALTLVFRDEWTLLRARMARNHVIVCGLGRPGLRLTRSLRSRGDHVVVVEVDAESEGIRAAQRAGAGVLIGDATDPEVLRRAGIERAARLISVCGQDGTNAAVAATARELARDRRRGRSLACVIHVYDPVLCEFLRRTQIAAAETTPFRLDVFNMFENGARAMLVDHPLTVEGAPERPHVVVVGLGRLGTSLVIEVALSWREHGLERHGTLPITLVDQHAEGRVRSLLLQHPLIEEACALRPVVIAVGQPEFELGEFFEEPWDAAYVCLDDIPLALDAAFRLGRQGGERARIVVRTDSRAGLGSLLDQRTEDQTPSVIAFPLLDRVCDAESVIGFTFTERLAREMHADYLARRPHDAADQSMQPWKALDEELRESNRDAARDVGRKLRVVGCEAHLLDGQEPPDFRFTDAEIELLARMEHERWMIDRQRNGWKPGPRGDPEAKTTPYLIAFDQLPRDVQDHDRNAVRSLPRILARTGYGIVRPS